MLRAFKYRLYPTKEQEILLAKTFGSCRYVYNWALSTKIEAYKTGKTSISCIALINRMKSELKAKYEWLNETNSQSLQSSIRNLDTAYSNFFRDVHHIGFPKFKSKKNNQSFQ